MPAAFAALVETADGDASMLARLDRCCSTPGSPRPTSPTPRRSWRRSSASPGEMADTIRALLADAGDLSDDEVDDLIAAYERRLGPPVPAGRRHLRRRPGHARQPGVGDLAGDPRPQRLGATRSGAPRIDDLLDLSARLAVAADDSDFTTALFDDLGAEAHGPAAARRRPPGVERPVHDRRPRLRRPHDDEPVQRRAGRRRRRQPARGVLGRRVRRRPAPRLGGGRQPRLVGRPRGDGGRRRVPGAVPGRRVLPGGGPAGRPAGRRHPQRPAGRRPVGPGPPRPGQPASTRASTDGDPVGGPRRDPARSRRRPHARGRHRAAPRRAQRLDPHRQRLRARRQRGRHRAPARLGHVVGDEVGDLIRSGTVDNLAAHPVATREAAANVINNAIDENRRAPRTRRWPPPMPRSARSTCTTSPSTASTPTPRRAADGHLVIGSTRRRPLRRAGHGQRRGPGDARRRPRGRGARHRGRRRREPSTAASAPTGSSSSASSTPSCSPASWATRSTTPRRPRPPPSSTTPPSPRARVRCSGPSAWPRTRRCCWSGCSRSPTTSAPSTSNDPTNQVQVADQPGQRHRGDRVRRRGAPDRHRPPRRRPAGRGRPPAGRAPAPRDGQRARRGGRPRCRPRRWPTCAGSRRHGGDPEAYRAAGGATLADDLDQFREAFAGHEEWPVEGDYLSVAEWQDRHLWSSPQGLFVSQ